MKYVKQEHEWGCGISCLAMVCNQTYYQVYKKLEDDDKRISRMSSGWREKNGLSENIIELYLQDEGFWLQKYYKIHYDQNVPPWNNSSMWPISPETDDGIIANVVQPSGNGHFVVIDNYNNVLDPLRSGTYDLTDWNIVNFIIGCRRV